jgi:leader peptidase (prepilin peptidase)/N-methyltransferase
MEVAIGWRIGLTAALPAYLFIGAVGWFVALIDAFERRIPNVVILPSYPITLALLVIASASEDEWYGLARGAIGMLALGAFYLVLALLRPGELGFGDVKLAGLLGLVLGWLGWRVLILGAFAGPALGAIGAIALFAARRVSGRTSFPFGPFLITGAFLAILIG